MSPSSASAGWNLQHTYRELPEPFYTAMEPTPVKAPRLVVLNGPLARELGLDPELMNPDIFAGNTLPEGAAPIAQAYAGHQYGNFTALGDGRAILLGEQITPAGERFDIQLKGPGPTPYSRRGDGRAALGPMLREYLISEAMHALGIPTTRSLAVAATGEHIWREEGGLPGAVLTRVAASHIRVGTFEWAVAAGGPEALRALLDHTVARHYPELAEAEDMPLRFLEAVMERQAELIARWMQVGFVHGVMNTDNMAISGETIDYGPCAFLDAYDPGKTFSSIDRQGRYAYGNQPYIAQWNLARFAETLLTVLHPDLETAIGIGTGAVKGFPDRYQRHWLAGMRRKLGLFNEEPEDEALIDALLAWMLNSKRDFTNTFAALSGQVPEDFLQNGVFAAWHGKWRERLARQQQSDAEAERLRRENNPAFIPRNHLVEAALAAAGQDDHGPLDRLMEVISNPYDHERELPEYRSPDPSGGAGYRTFCGT